LVSSLLGDDGIVSGCCEGDMNPVIAMYLLQEFSGQPVHFGEMLEVNEKENSVITSHCGCCSVKLAVVLIFFYRGQESRNLSFRTTPNETVFQFLRL
jgi:hypothetical protein